jgi:hypothetical protein
MNSAVNESGSAASSQVVKQRATIYRISKELPLLPMVQQPTNVSKEDVGGDVVLSSLTTTELIEQYLST